MVGDEVLGPVKVVMCVTTCNRTAQLAMALSYNLTLSWSWRNMVRWVLVDFNPPEERRRVVNMLHNIAPMSLAAGQLRVFGAGPWSGWHASVAKNTSHCIALREYGMDCVLCNFDGDNIATIPFLRDITANAERMSRWRNMAHWDGDRFSGATLQSSDFPEITGTSYRAPHASSTTGRIALGARMFAALRGYDENFEPMGAQDVDLIRRLRKLGDLRYIHSDFLTGNAVRNCLSQVTKAERWTRECAAKMANVAPSYRSSTWDEMNQRNLQRHKAAMAMGHIQRNKSQTYLGISCNELGFDVGGVSPIVGGTSPTAAGQPSSASFDVGGVSSTMGGMSPMAAGPPSSASPVAAAPTCIIRRCIIYTLGVDDRLTKYEGNPVLTELRNTTGQSTEKMQTLGSS
jgi:hypothetical protein